jgi:Xaa-Pro aminopeptidase
LINLKRVEKTKEILRSENIGCFLTTDVKNIYYLTGFLDILGATLNMLIRPEGEPLLLVTPLSLEAAISGARDCVVEGIKVEESVNERVIKEIKNISPKRIGYDSLQLQTYLDLTKRIGAEFCDKGDVISRQRRIKDDEEINLIQRACEIADIGMEAAVEAIHPGAKEYEIASQAEYEMRKNGSMGTAFETLVASGPRSAYPHGVSSERKILDSDIVTVDLGAVWKGYCSDITRTVIAGKPLERDLRTIQRVMRAHDKALEQMRSGVEATMIDGLVRKTLGARLKPYFIHGLGHGVGLAIHEAPTISQTTKDVLETGNVVTDEPGVYFHGYGGVRIEDTVLILREGCKKLTCAPYP